MTDFDSITFLYTLFYKDIQDENIKLIFFFLRWFRSYVTFLFISGFVTFFFFCPLFVIIYYAFPNFLYPISNNIFILNRDSNLRKLFVFKVRFYSSLLLIFMFVSTFIITYFIGIDLSFYFSSTFYLSFMLWFRVTRIILSFYFKSFTSFVTLYHYNFNPPAWELYDKNTTKFELVKIYFYKLYLPCKYYIEIPPKKAFPRFVYIQIFAPLKRLFYGLPKP